MQRTIFCIGLGVSLLLSIPIHSAPAAQRNEQPYDQTVEKGPHHRNWDFVREVVNENGQKVQERARYTELQTGMHYREDNQWKDSREEIEVFKDGAVARKGGHKVIFSPNINVEGAIDLLAPDGKRFRSRVLGLSYYDAASGKSALIAEIKDSIGRLVAPNQIVYPDAFTDLKADLRYTWTKGGFEQDVILVGIPPAPELFGLPSASTRLQVWTEFFAPPQPRKTVQILKRENDPLKRLQMAAPDLTDETLDFEAMSVGPGQAFVLNGQRRPAGAGPRTFERVAKNWMKVEGRDFLIEEVEYPAMAERIRALLRQGVKMEGPKRPATSRTLAASLQRKVPKRKRDSAGEQRILLAQSSYVSKGYVIDYAYVTSANNLTFEKRKPTTSQALRFLEARQPLKGRR